MRTTVDIEDDVLLAVKDAASREGIPLGRMISRLVRKGLTPETPRSLNGVLVFEAKADAPLVTMETVNRLRDED